MELRIELDGPEEDEAALGDLIRLLRDEGIDYRFDDTDDPRALGPDPVAIINVVLATVNTVAVVLTTVNALRAGRAGKVVAEDGREAEIGTDEGKLGETLHGWIFKDGPKAS